MNGSDVLEIASYDSTIEPDSTQVVSPDEGEFTAFKSANASEQKNNKPKKRHICQLCNKEFTKKCGLSTHLLIHAGVKPFVCEICNKTFTKKCTLTVHLLTHSSEKPFTCEICDKAFARKTDLQKHNFVHSGEKRYVCDICNTGFTHQNNLRRHKLKHISKESVSPKLKDVSSSLKVGNEKSKQDIIKLQSLNVIPVGIKKSKSESECLKDSCKKFLDVKEQSSLDASPDKSSSQSNCLPSKDDMISKILSASIQTNSLKTKNQMPIFININLPKPVQNQAEKVVMENMFAVSSSNIKSDMKNVKTLNQSQLKNFPLLSLAILKDSMNKQKVMDVQNIKSPVFINKTTQINDSVVKEVLDPAPKQVVASHCTDNIKILDLEKTSEFLTATNYSLDSDNLPKITDIVNTVLKESKDLNNSLNSGTNSCQQNIDVINFSEMHNSSMPDEIKSIESENNGKEPCGILPDIELTPNSTIDIDKLIEINDSILKGFVGSDIAGSFDPKVFSEANVKSTNKTLTSVERISEKSNTDSETSSIFNSISLDAPSSIDIDKLIKFNESVILKETANLNDSLKSLQGGLVGLNNICNDSKVITQNTVFSLEDPAINFSDSGEPDPNISISEVIRDTDVSNSVIDISKLIKLNNSFLMKESASMNTDFSLNKQENENINKETIINQTCINGTQDPTNSIIDINTLIKLNNSAILKDDHIFEKVTTQQSNLTPCKDVLDSDFYISNVPTVVTCQTSVISNAVISATKLPTYPVIHLEETASLNEPIVSDKIIDVNGSTKHLDFSNIESDVSVEDPNFTKVQESNAVNRNIIPIEKDLSSTPIPMLIIAKENLSTVDEDRSKDSPNVDIPSISVKATEKVNPSSLVQSLVAAEKNFDVANKNIQVSLHSSVLSNTLPKVVQTTASSNIIQILQNSKSSKFRISAPSKTDEVMKNSKQNDIDTSLLNVKSIQIPVLCLDNSNNKSLLSCKLSKLRRIQDSQIQDSQSQTLGLKSKILVLTAPMKNVSSNSSPPSYAQIQGTENVKNKLKLVGNILPLLPGNKTAPIKTVSTLSNIDIQNKHPETNTEKNKVNLVGSIFPLLSGTKLSQRKETGSTTSNLKETSKPDMQRKEISSTVSNSKETSKLDKLISVFQKGGKRTKSMDNIDQLKRSKQETLSSEKDVSVKSFTDNPSQCTATEEDAYKKNLEDDNLSYIQELFTCDKCGKIFEDKDAHSTHMLNHSDGDGYQCYLCRETFDSSNLLHMHVLTHSGDTLEDMDALSLDGELDSSKFGPLTPGDISLDEIDKIDLEEDFDEKVARMYALAHVEDDNSDTEDSNDDETTKVYALSHNSSDNVKERTSDSSKMIFIKPKGDFKSPCKGSEKNTCSTVDTVKASNKNISPVLDDDIACDGFDSEMALKIASTDMMHDKSSLNIISKLHSKISTHLRKVSEESYISSDDIDDMLDIDLSDSEEFYSKDFKELDLINSDLGEESVFSHTENLEDNLDEISEDIMKKVQTLEDNEDPENVATASNDKNMRQNSKLHPVKSVKSFKLLGKSKLANLMNKDMTSDKKKRNYVCHICEKMFMRKQYLQTHYLMHAGIKPYICEICYKTFTKKCSLTIHSLIHTGEKKHSCRECKKTFGRKTDLQKHILIHSGHKPYKCDVCHKGFNHQNNLRRHKLIHLNKKLHVCDICNQRFSERVNLLTHMKIHIKEEEINKMNGFSNSNITNHLRSIKEKLHACDHCGMLFARRDRLLKHKATHIARTLHPCEVCGSTFKNRDQLQIHLLNHIDIAFDDIEDNIDSVEDLDLIKLEPSLEKVKKTYACNQCFKVYTRHSALKCHYLTHTGERPHECHICKKRFAQRTTLKRHILAHSGIKPYKCEVCDKAFAREPSLRKHYVTHTSNKVVC